MLFVAFLVLCGIYIYSQNENVVVIRAGELNEDLAGQSVQMSGHIEDVELKSGGGLAVTLIDYQTSGTSSVKIAGDAFAEDGGPDIGVLMPGAKILIRGIVEEYKGYLWIQVESGIGVRLLQKAENNSVELGVLLESPSLFRGQIICIEGFISSVWTIGNHSLPAGFGFEIYNYRDDVSYSVTCAIFLEYSQEGGDDDTVYELPDSGERAKFTGTFDYYSREGCWEITSRDTTGLTSLRLLV